MAAGRIREVHDGKLVFYVEGLSDDGRTMTNVFVETESNGVRKVLAAERGYYVVNPDSGDRYLVLQNGHRYDGQPSDPQFKIIAFKEHGLLVEEQAVTPGARKVIAHTTPQLLAQLGRYEVAELQWRVAMPRATVLLAALAVPRARTTPRQGRFAKLFVAVLVYVVYMNLLVASRSWLERGTVSPLLGMWWVHGLMQLLVGASMLRQLGVGWRSRPLRKAAPA